MSRTNGSVTVTQNAPQIPVPDLEALRARLRGVIRMSADFAKAVWHQRAQDLAIRRSGAYLQGIQDAVIRPLSEVSNGSEVSAVFEVVNTCPHARVIEDGHPAYSLAAAIDWSSRNGKIQRTAAGVPYLRIPFGHSAYATPEQRAEQGLTLATMKRMMPADVYAAAKQLQPGKSLPATATGPRFTGGAETTETWRSARTLVGRSASGQKLSNPAWQSGRHDRLFKAGSVGHTRYLTIRVITPHSRGFNIPAQPGYGVARQVARVLNGGVGSQRFRDLLTKAMRDAVAAP